jgi:hypothetical protein
MSEIEHARTLGKVHQYSNTKYCSWPGLLIDSLKIMTAVAGDILLRIEYSAESHAFTTEKNR